jgi:hypothetical protein
MAIDSRHPDFIQVEPDYRVMRDTFGGERIIKEATIAYLPATGGQIADGALTNYYSAGWQAYSAYLTRAVFPDFVKQAVETMVGVMHREEPVIELPAALEPMREHATRKGETLQMLLRRINEQQLLYGRYGLLADFPQDPFAARLREVPHLVEYVAETIVNWDDERMTEFGVNELGLLVLNEVLPVRGSGGADMFEWMQEDRYRVALLEPVNPDADASVRNPLIYKTFVEVDNERSETIIPKYQGSPFGEIPFVFIGSNDLNPTPDEIPLLGLAKLSLAIYRGEADYRQALHLLGQDTLVIVGDEVESTGEVKDESAETRVGAGAIIRLNPGEGVKADFIGIDSKGAPEQRVSLDKDKTEARSMGARLLEPRGTQAESGEALRIRVTASTATLHTIALTGATGLESILKMCARWVGANPDEVRITPNTDFAQDSPDPEQLQKFNQARAEGAPISERSLHKWAQDKNFTRMEFDEEMALVEAERAKKEAKAARIAAQTTPVVEPEEDEDEE